MLGWADDDNIVHASSSSAALPAPQPSREGAGTRARPASTPHILHPLQEYFSPSVTPRSRRRLEDIEAGLKQREQDLSPTRQAGSLREAVPSTSSPSAQAIPQPPSPVPTEVDCEDEAQPQKTYSFLGLHYSPEPIISTIKDDGQPSTPPTEGAVIQPAAVAASSGGGLLLTPPQTTRRVTRSDEAKSILHSRKGKEREGGPPVQTQNQVCARPFHYPCNIVVRA